MRVTRDPQSPSVPEAEPLLEAFLVIEQPRQRLSHWAVALSPLDESNAPPFASVCVSYDPTADQALIGLRYDRMAVGDAGLAFLMDVALLAEIGMIQPAELTEGDRMRFVTDRLAGCTLHVNDQRTIVGALIETVRRVRELRSNGPKAVLASIPVRPPSHPQVVAHKPQPSARGLPSRGDTADPVLLVKPKGTRDDLPARTVEPPPPPRIAEPDEPDEPEIQVVPARAASRHVIPRDVHRAATVQMPRVDAERMVAESMPPAPAGIRRARSPSHAGTEPYLPAAIEPTPPTVIYARYLRSGRWVPIRIGSLSLKGAALMTGALPRVNDHVDVAFSFGGHRALVRGPVGKVSSVEEAAQSGAATFSVAFELDDTARRQLTSLLTAARAAKVTIKPPPPRAARRYPVEWPVNLGTFRGTVRGEALDVSRDGMFVRPLHALTLETVVNFSSVLDDGDAPVAGRAKVVRHVTEVSARACGLTSGYGLQIVDMGDVDRTRWQQYLARIEKRAERRVLVGASPSRLAELTAQLSAAGYAVTGGTDPDSLVRLASADVRPVDAAVIDASWLTPQLPAEKVESMLSARAVPCVVLHGDARRARSTIDKLLAVV